jgi:hypothetical protein
MGVSLRRAQDLSSSGVACRRAGYSRQSAALAPGEARSCRLHRQLGLWAEINLIPLIGLLLSVHCCALLATVAQHSVEPTAATARTRNSGLSLYVYGAVLLLF